MRVNLARLNHILIPTTKRERDKARKSRLVKVALPIVWLYLALSEEGRFLAIASIFVGGAGLEVPSNQIHLLWAALTGLLVASLLLRGPFALDGVRLEVKAPRRVTVGEEVTFALTLASDAKREHQAVRVAGPFLPWDGSWTGGEPRVASLLPGARVELAAKARFVERGEHHLDSFRAGALVPLGLAVGREVDSSDTLFMVVPRIAPVETLRTPEGNRYQPGGVALASRTGESMELLGVRPYRPGDPIRDLHARSSARAGKPVVREFQQEFFSRIGVVLDTDGSADPDALEAGISLAAGVIANLTRGEALIDVLVVGDRVEPFTLGRSLGFLEQALDLLACVKPGPPPQADSLVAGLAPYLGRLSCVVFVALAWDEPRQRLVEELRRRGVGVRTLLVGAGPGADPRVTPVPLSAIVAGEPLVL